MGRKDNRHPQLAETVEDGSQGVSIIRKRRPMDRSEREGFSDTRSWKDLELSKEYVTSYIAGRYYGAGDTLRLEPSCTGRRGSAEEAPQDVHYPAIHFFR